MSSVVTSAPRDNAAASSPTVTFLDVIGPAGQLLLRTFNTAEAAGFKRAYDSLRAPGDKTSSIEQRVATLAT